MVIAGARKPKTNAQLEIFSVIERKKRQIKKKEDPAQFYKRKEKIDDNIRLTQEQIDSNITQLDKALTAYSKMAHPSRFVKQEIIKIKSKLKINWLGNSLLKKLKTYLFEPLEITKDIDLTLNGYILNKKYTNSKQDKILDNISKIRKNLESEDVTILDKRELFLKLTINIMRLHKTLYDTHVSRHVEIDRFNAYFKKLLKDK